jgi:hypothetical protein
VDRVKFCEACDRTGHRWDPGIGWVRCACLEKDLVDRRLGPFAAEKPYWKTSLTEVRKADRVLEGSLAALRPHVARVLLDMDAAGETWEVVTSQRLAEIWLRDEEVRTTAYLAEPDLVILILGMGELKNKELPTLILELLHRRELVRKPTWTVVPFPFGQLATRYNEDVARAFADVKRSLL